MNVYDVMNMIEIMNLSFVNTCRLKRAQNKHRNSNFSFLTKENKV